MQPDIQAILEAAIQAPSGENVQPWRFHVSEGTIDQYHVDVDTEIYDTGNRGSYISHGAALENICLWARTLGYEPEVTLFPDAGNKKHIARIVLNHAHSGGHAESELAGSISERHTNRNPYSKQPVTDETNTALEAAASAIPSVEFLQITEPASIQKLAGVGSTNEEVMLQNETLHNFFFNHVTWTKKEDTEKREGFYIKTLGLPLPVQGLFHLFKMWSVMSFLKSIGFPAQIGKGNAATYASSAEIGLLRIKTDSPEAFVNAGRALERIWLTAAAKGLSLQPLAGTLFMHNYITMNPASAQVFSSYERSLVEKAISVLHEIVGNEGVIAFMFRVGYGKPPEATASRFPLEHFLV